MQVDEKSQKVIHKVDGKKLKNMFISGLNKLKSHKELIDSLNVFPVPDGDTGTNMYLTFLEGIKKIKSLNSNRVDKITSSLSHGSLMGARGNSGVILSQLLRGFSESNEDNKYMEPENLAESLRKASDIAYQGVMKPVEGTILTVSRGAARGAKKALENNKDIVGVLQEALQEAKITLNKTPEQLPELKEAGVVDAGGKGYYIILKGILEGLVGESQNLNQDLQVVEETSREKKVEAEIKFIYDTQILLDLDITETDKNINDIREDLQSYGDSLVVVGSDNTIKIHIHSNHPGVVLEYTLKLGEVRDINIENMKLQSEEFHKNEHETVDLPEDSQKNQKEEPNQRGLISVVQGQGLKNIFLELGVGKIIDGGQSMNPSTNDFIEAIEDINNEEIIIFPNNDNIISAAQQAASLSDKKVVVVPTESIAEGVSALMVNNEQLELSELQEDMKEEMEFVKTLKITKAVKNSSVNGMEIQKNDILGLYGDDIKVKNSSYKKVIVDLFKQVWENEDLITIYYGENIEEEEVDSIIELLKNEFDIEEIEKYFGGQTLYPYIISLE